MPPIANDKDYDPLFSQLYHKLSPRIKTVLLSTFLWGFLAHGMALFNKYSTHDEIHFLFSLGATFSSGRWLLGLMDDFLLQFWGGPHYSLPLFNGLVSIALLAIAICFVILTLDIRRREMVIAVSGIMVVYPAITGTFGFFFTAPFYMLAVLLSTSGAWLICRFRKWYTFLGGAALIGSAVGIYQGYIPLTISIFLLYFMGEAQYAKDWNWQELFRLGFYLVGGCIAFLAFYLGMNKLFLALYHVSLSNYHNIDQMGQASITEYGKRILRSYRFFLQPERMQYTHITSYMYPMRLLTLYRIVLVCIGGLSLHRLGLVWKTNRQRAIAIAVAMALLPLAVNFMLVMCAPSDIHSLMVYGQVMVFVYFARLLETAEFSRQKCKRGLFLGGSALLLLVIGMYCRFDNAYYLRAEMEKQQTISYYTTIVTQIKSTDGYRDEYPVVFLNDMQIQDLSLAHVEEFDPIAIEPIVGLETSVNRYSKFDFLSRWCGYAPQWGNAEDFEALPEVEAMPHYPDQGAIQIIHDTIVVKF